jgi:hypothetical protein
MEEMYMYGVEHKKRIREITPLLDTAWTNSRMPSKRKKAKRNLSMERHDVTVNNMIDRAEKKKNENHKRVRERTYVAKTLVCYFLSVEPWKAILRKKTEWAEQRRAEKNSTRRNEKQTKSRKCKIRRRNLR